MKITEKRDVIYETFDDQFKVCLEKPSISCLTPSIFSLADFLSCFQLGIFKNLSINSFIIYFIIHFVQHFHYNFYFLNGQCFILAHVN
jgi:hypothetical protein